MNRKRLFLDTISELERRSKSQDPYDNLMIAGLLGKLLLDSHSLVDEVNKEFRIKIKYKLIMQVPPSTPSLVFWSVQDGIDPNDPSPGSPLPVELGIDKFLKVPILILNGHTYDIKESINFLRNKAGAVHIGKNSSEKEDFLDSSVQPIARNMKAVSRIVLSSLDHLVECLRTS